jgi:hypothetical protein
MDLDVFARRFIDAIASFPNQLKVRLLRILDMPDEERAARSVRCSRTARS